MKLAMNQPRMESVSIWNKEQSWGDFYGPENFCHRQEDDRNIYNIAK
jgi:hypothetical protein